VSELKQVAVGTLRGRQVSIIDRDRFTGSSGFYVSSNANSSYRVGAIVPQAPWRPVEVSAVDAAEGACRYNSVFIFRVPHGILSSSGFAPESICRAYAKNSASLPGDAPRFAELLKSLLCIRSDVTVHGIASRPAGLATTTVDRASGLYVGLHIDSWGDLSISDRLSSKMRLNVNLGPGRRYFLFAAHTLSSVVATHHIHPDDGRRLAIVERDYFSDDRARILRLELYPGDAYMASTDALIHDGSTLSSSLGSYTFDFQFQPDSGTDACLQHW